MTPGMDSGLYLHNVTRQMAVRQLARKEGDWRQFANLRYRPGPQPHGSYRKRASLQDDSRAACGELCGGVKGDST